jgi:NADH-dependent formate dehydrogenase delta subunit FdsD
MDVDKLVKMANQIAANSDYGSDKDRIAGTIADHLTRFWTPAMRKAIIEGHQKKLVDLSPTAARAVEKLVMPTSGL